MLPGQRTEGNCKSTIVSSKIVELKPPMLNASNLDEAFAIVTALPLRDTYISEFSVVLGLLICGIQSTQLKCEVKQKA